MSAVKKNQVYVDEQGQVMTVQRVDDTGVHVDEEGSKKKFMDPQEFEEYVKDKKYEKSNVLLNDEDDPDDDVDMDLDLEGEDDFDIPDPEDDDTDEEEEEIPMEDEEPDKKEQFKDLYNQMLDLGSTGNDKIDKAVEKLKKELSSELNSMTSESLEEMERELKAEGYIK